MRPYREYQIGVDIQRGRSQYTGTRVVTMVARYQLENKTQYKIAYLQQHQLEDQVCKSMIIKITLQSICMYTH